MSVIYCPHCKNAFCSDKKSSEINCPKCGRAVPFSTESELNTHRDEIYLEALHKKKIALYARDLWEAYEIFTYLGSYREANLEAESCKYLAELQERREKEEIKERGITKKQVKKIVIIALSAIVALSLLISCALMLVSPIKYSRANGYLEKGELEKAAEIFAEIPDYMHSLDKLKEIYSELSEKAGKKISCSALEPYFAVNNSGSITFIRSKYTGDGNIVIPDILDGKEIKSLAPNIFKNFYRLKSVTLPSELKSIGSYAFYDCKNLESIEIPESVTVISPYAFKDCVALKNINIPSSVTIIHAFVFTNCKALESPKLPENLEKIDNSAFMGCISFKHAKIPSKVTEISTFAFSACTALDTISLPKSLTEIGKGAFSRCDSLLSVNYGGSEEDYKKIVIGENNEPLNNATKYPTSKTPSLSGVIESFK